MIARDLEASLYQFGKHASLLGIVRQSCMIIYLLADQILLWYQSLVAKNNKSSGGTTGNTHIPTGSHTLNLLFILKIQSTILCSRHKYLFEQIYLYLGANLESSLILQKKNSPVWIF